MSLTTEQLHLDVEKQKEIRACDKLGKYQTSILSIES